MIIATAGHVDHGKTALVKALTGVNTDTLEEEKRRGLTIEAGFAYCDMGSVRIGFVDVPGHHQFVNNMLCGVAGIDAVMLVIAADEGIMPQTVEHLRIVELLGVEHALLVISRIDRADPELLAILEGDIKTLVRGTCLEHVPCVNTSAPRGDGIGELRSRLVAMAAALPLRPIEGNFRMAVDRTFILKGTGVVVTGFVHAGEIQTHDELILCPDNIPVRVRGIFSNDRPANAASVGHRCALNLGGVDFARTHRGQWLTTKDANQGTRRIDVRLTLPADARNPLRHWTPVHVFHGATHVTGRVALSEGPVLDPGSRSLAQLVLESPIVATHGDVCILRNQASNETLAGAVVLDIFASRQDRRHSARLARLGSMENPDPTVCLRSLISTASDGVEMKQFRLNRNLTVVEAQDVFRRAPTVLISTEDGTRGLHPDHWEKLGRDIHQCITGWHESRPESPGIRLNELRATVDPPPSPALLKAALDTLIHGGEVKQTGPAYHLRDFRPKLADENAALWNIVYNTMKESEMRPPTIEELATASGLTVESTRALLTQAENMKLVVQLEPNRFFLPETLLQLAHKLVELAGISPDGRVTTAAYRDQSGLGRNLTISVLEHFDAMQFTRRIGNSRCLIKAVDVVFDNQSPAN